MKSLHVWPQEVGVADGWATYSARVEDETPFTVWFKTPEANTHLLTTRAESFAAATILLAMKRGRTLHVHAPLAPSFLRNLEELQALWACWHPPFQRVDMTADAEQESQVQAPNRAISTFSGGVDSCYTAWRHTQKRCGRRALPLQTSLMMHGSEIELGRDAMFETALARSQRLLDSIDVNLVRMATNFRTVLPYDYVGKWFGTMLTATLLFFQESHTTGLIPASFSYYGLVLPYASTPLNDPLFSTSRFTIEHDGADRSRADKLAEIMAWPQVLENLRVCNQPDYADVNCGKCEKCVRNILALRIVGVQNPPCFPTTPTDEDIARVEVNGTSLEAMRRVVSSAQQAGVQASWVNATQKCVRANEKRVRHQALRENLRRTAKSHLPQPFWQAGRALKNQFSKN